MSTGAQQAAEELHQEIEELLQAGRYTEARRRLGALDALVVNRGVTRDTRIWLLNVAARIEMQLGKSTARERLLAALRLSRRSDDPALRGVTLLNLGAEASLTGKRRLAARYWLRALGDFGANNDYARYSQALLNLLGLMIEARRFEDAEEIVRNLITMLRGARDPWGRFGVYMSLGQLRAAQGEFKAAADAFRAALTAARRTGEDTRIAAALQNLGSAYLDLGRPKRALATYQRAMQSPAAAAATRFRAVLLRSLALARLRDHDALGAESALAESRRIAARVGDAEAFADATSDLGGLRISQQHWGAARRYLNSSLSTYERLGRQVDVARVLSNLAALEEARHDLQGAASLLVRAADALDPENGDRWHLIEQAGDLWLSADRVSQATDAYQRAIVEKTDSDPRTKAWSFLMSGAKLAQGPEPRAALPFFSGAIDRYRRLKESQMRFHALNDRALCYARLGDLRSAAEDLRRAISIGRRRDDRAMFAQGFLNLGEVVRRQGKPVRAAALLRRSAAAARGLGDIGAEAAALGNLGLALLQAHDFDAAERTLMRASELAETVRDAGTLALANGGLGNVAMNRGDYGEALPRYIAASRAERRLDIQPQLAESMAAVCELLAAAPNARRRFERTLQQLVDMCQENRLEQLGAATALRSARWYLHRGDLATGADVLAIGLALTAMDQSDEAPTTGVARAVVEAAFYWIIHVPDTQGEFVPRTVSALERLHRSLGKIFEPLLRSGVDRAAWIPTKRARRDWARRVERIQVYERARLN